MHARWAIFIKSGWRWVSKKHSFLTRCFANLSIFKTSCGFYLSKHIYHGFWYHDFVWSYRVWTSICCRVCRVVPMEAVFSSSCGKRSWAERLGHCVCTLTLVVVHVGSGQRAYVQCGPESKRDAFVAALCLLEMLPSSFLLLSTSCCPPGFDSCWIWCDFGGISVKFFQEKKKALPQYIFYPQDFSACPG